MNVNENSNSTFEFPPLLKVVEGRANLKSAIPLENGIGFFLVDSFPETNQLVIKSKGKEEFCFQTTISVPFPAKVSAKLVTKLIPDKKDTEINYDVFSKNNENTSYCQQIHKLTIVSKPNTKVIVTIGFQVQIDNTLYSVNDILIPIVLYGHSSLIDLVGAFADACYLQKDVISYDHASWLANIYCKEYVLKETSQVKKQNRKRTKTSESDSNSNYSFNTQSPVSKEELMYPFDPTKSKALEILLKKVVKQWGDEKSFPKRSEFKRFLYALSKIFEYIQKEFIVDLWIKGMIIISDGGDEEKLLLREGYFCIRLSTSFFALLAQEYSDKNAVAEGQNTMGPFVVPIHNGEKIIYWNQPLRYYNRNLIDVINSTKVCSTFVAPGFESISKGDMFVDKDEEIHFPAHGLQNGRYITKRPMSNSFSQPSTPLQESSSYTQIPQGEFFNTQVLEMDTGVLDINDINPPQNLSPQNVNFAPSTPSITSLPPYSPQQPSVPSSLSDIAIFLSGIGLSHLISKFESEALTLQSLFVIEPAQFIETMRAVPVKLGEALKIQAEIKKLQM